MGMEMSSMAKAMLQQVQLDFPQSSMALRKHAFGLNQRIFQFFVCGEVIQVSQSRWQFLLSQLAHVQVAAGVNSSDPL